MPIILKSPRKPLWVGCLLPILLIGGGELRGGQVHQGHLEPPPAVQDRPAVDSTTVEQIKGEGFERSEVMDLASWLTDVHGPRLTGSTILEDAGRWVLERLEEWGVDSPRHERWGPFGPAWVNERTVVHVTDPVPFPVIAHPHPWSPGTDGPVKAEAIISPVEGDEGPWDFEALRGTLEGKVVLLAPEPRLALPVEPLARRYTSADLDSIAEEEFRPPRAGGSEGGTSLARGRSGRSTDELLEFFHEEGVVAVLMATSRPPGGGVVHLRTEGARLLDDAPPTPPVLSVAAEHYGRIYRVLERGIPVELEVDIRNRFGDRPEDGFNVLAELPGTELSHEVVTLGAHLDSWHMATGAADNAAGSAAVLEAFRILAAVGPRLRRTVRLALWTGEEQGLLGSRVHVLRRYGSQADPTPDHDSLSLYLNLDNGAGAIRGVSLQGNAAGEPIFRDWFEWVDSDSISVRHTSLRYAGATDHVSFHEAGLPGFQFIQDPLDYGTRAHHSSMDFYERLPERDMKHNAVVLAVLTFLAANAENRFPRH